MTMQFCPQCGSPVTTKIPDGDNRLRHVCGACGTIHYENPKMVVGCIPEWQDSILLCRRNIQPQQGKWTLPAGYLENHETMTEGAQRETYEETHAKVEIIAPYRLFDLAFISQMYIMFRARLVNTDFEPTRESSEVQLFTEHSIPWDDIAFSVIYETLKHYFTDRQNGVFPFENHQINGHGHIFQMRSKQ